jgi:hypothetical protein
LSWLLKSERSQALRWAGLTTKIFDMKTELDNNEKLSTKQETPPIANCCYAMALNSNTNGK